MMVDFELISINDALKNNAWVKSMKEEREAIERNKTWELIIFPKNKKTSILRWVFEIKLKPYGSISKHKAISVARVFLKKLVYENHETYSTL